jgi:GPH family glycoside/pentoside/hexuronide:cation symporter
VNSLVPPKKGERAASPAEEESYASAPYQRLSLPQRVGLGTGGIPDLGMQYAIMVMASPIFNVAFGVSPVLIGIAMSLPRFWEILIDPWIGGLSDRTRGRLGRRHPYILAGGILGGMIFALVWWVPMGWSAAAKGVWLIVLALLHFTAYSIFMVPYSALLGEVTSNPLERTRVMAMRTVFTTLCSGSMAWLYWLCQRPWLGGTVEGMRVVGIGFGVLMAVAAIMPALVCRKSRQFHAHDPAPARESEFAVVKELLAVREFRDLLIAVFGLVGSFTLVGNLGFYVTVYYVYRGDTVSAAFLQGISGVVGCITGVIACPLVAFLARKIGRWPTLRLFLFIAVAGALSSWWTARPEWPYASIISGVLLGQGLTAFWILVPALTGEISNKYEKRTGRSLYGSFFAIYGVAIKLAGSISLLFTGLVLNATGFLVALGRNQLVATLNEMRLLGGIIPALGLVLAFFCLRALHIRADRPSY